MVPKVLSIDEFGQNHAVKIFLHNINPVFWQVIRVINNLRWPRLVEHCFKLLKTFHNPHQDGVGTYFQKRISNKGLIFVNSHQVVR